MKIKMMWDWDTGWEVVRPGSWADDPEYTREHYTIEVPAWRWHLWRIIERVANWLRWRGSHLVPWPERKRYES